MKRSILCLALSAIPLAVSGQASAQTEGLILGAALNASALSVEDSDNNDTGAGISLTAGYGFGLVAPYARLSVASMGSGDDGDAESDGYTLSHLDIGARASFPVAGLVPYLNGSYTFQIARFHLQGQSAGYFGTGFTVGGGVQYFVGRAALELALNITAGTFTEADVGDRTFDVELGTTTARLDIGIAFATGSGAGPAVSKWLTGFVSGK